MTVLQQTSYKHSKRQRANWSLCLFLFLSILRTPSVMRIIQDGYRCVYQYTILRQFAEKGPGEKMALKLSEKALNVKPSSTLAITARAKELKGQGIDVVGFGAGEPDLPTPENICDAAVEAVRSGFTKYTPASGTQELKEAVAAKFRRFNHLEYKPSQIVISNGGKHALTNIFTALLDPGDEVIIPAPYWLSYPEMVRLAGGVPVFVRSSAEDSFKVTADQIEAAVTDRTKALVLNTPNNPTGMVISRDELAAIADVAVRHDFYVVADEMYENLVYGGEEHVSIASLGDEIYARTITCSGLSKGYSMTGWRVGYTGSPEEIARVMGAVQSHQTSNINSIAQKAAVEALNGPQDSVDRMREIFDERRRCMCGRLAAMPYLRFQEPLGAFYCFVCAGDVLGHSLHGKEIGSVENMASILLNEYHVAIVPCADFGYPAYFRLSYAISGEQIQKGMDRIEQFLRDLD